MVLWDLQRLIDGTPTTCSGHEIVFEAIEMFELWVDAYGPATDVDVAAIEDAKAHAAEAELSLAGIDTLNPAIEHLVQCG